MADTKNTKTTGAAGFGGEEEQRLTVHSYGAINVNSVQDECWLIRIPQGVADIWEKAEEGTELGDLIFTKGGTLPNKKTIKPAITVELDATMVREQLERAAAKKAKKNKSQKADAASPAASSPASGANIKMPALQYSLQAMTKKVPTMHPFIRNPVTGSVELMGVVSRTANLQVERNDTNYRSMLKDRLVATNVTNNRYVKPVEATESILTKQQKNTANAQQAATNAAVQQGSLPSGATTTKGGKKTFGDAVYQYGKRLLEAANDNHNNSSAGGANKKARQFAPDQPLRSVLFELFAQQQYWTIKDIKAAAIAGGVHAANHKKAEAEIREILRDEIGDYHRGGDHKNKWELRKEYKNQQNI